MKLKILQNDRVTEPEESLTLKPFDIPKFQETPLLKPDSKTKSELKSELSKPPKDLDEFAESDRNKTKRDLDTPNNKTSTDRSTHHKPISEPKLDQEDAKTKKDKSVVETVPGITVFSYFQCLSVYSSWAVAPNLILPSCCSLSNKNILFSLIIEGV